MSEKSSPTNLFLLICTIGIILLIIFVLIKTKRDSNLLDEKGRYTIGITQEVVSRPNGYWVKYNFCYNKIEANGMKRMGDSVKKNGGRYLVLFYPEDILNNEIYWDKPIPKGIVAPLEGWDSIPMFLK